MAYRIGDVVKFDVSFEYQGPIYVFGKVRCVIGVRGAFFNEIDWKEQGINMPETLAWNEFTLTIPVTLKNVKMGERYDTYVKVMPKLSGQSDIFWYGDGLVQMGEVAVDSEFRNLTVRIS